MHLAVIQNETVVNIIEHDTTEVPGLTLVEIPEEVQIGWIYANEVFAPPAPNPLVIQKSLVDAVQNHLDSTAQQRNYDGILSLCTYVTSTNPKFAAEGQAGVVWRDACWEYCYILMAEVLAGVRDVPTPEQLISELPSFVWPV